MPKNKNNFSNKSLKNKLLVKNYKINKNKTKY